MRHGSHHCSLEPFKDANLTLRRPPQLFETGLPGQAGKKAYEVLPAIRFGQRFINDREDHRLDQFDRGRFATLSHSFRFGCVESDRAQLFKIGSAPLQHLANQIFLRVEVIIHRRDVDLRLVGDVANGGAGDPEVCEQFFRGGQDTIDRGSGLGGLA